jgi:UDP-N-acetyl-D-mannosaminuronic acid dehydrogenase
LEVIPEASTLLCSPVLTASKNGSKARDLDLVILGGCGHVGLPLALAFAAAGCRVGVYDSDEAKLEQVSRGQMPFHERGAVELLSKVLAAGRLSLSHEHEVLQRSDVVIIVIGTPIDEFLNPSLKPFDRLVDEISLWLPKGALLVLRSTVYPGTTEYVERRLKTIRPGVKVVFCPERIAEGHALEEIPTLPQLIGANDDEAFRQASGLFERLGVEVVRTTPQEAELAKLMTNAWRYMKFAIANQFFQIACRAGIDYGRVLRAIRHNYPRGKDLPGPGFAAGPCLFKDTMQLAAFTPDHFPMGHAAMLVNEGLPGFIVDMLDGQKPLAGRTLGILGMAFKGESDDIRSSLSYKLKKLAAFKGARVLCTDPYVKDRCLVPLERVLQESDLLIVAAPHHAYHSLDLSGREVVDLWEVTGGGSALFTGRVDRRSASAQPSAFFAD